MNKGLSSFSLWLGESKGIRLTPEVERSLDEMLPKIQQAAVQSKETGRDVDVGTIEYEDPYFPGRHREVNVTVVNEPGAGFDGDYGTLFGLRVNVAHVEEITPLWLRRVMVHELIHSQDPKKSDFETGARMGFPRYSTSGMDYYRHPQEFDAYTGQIVDSILKYARIHRGRPEVGKVFDDTLEYIRNPNLADRRQVYGVIGDKDYWKTFHTYMQYGSPIQKRKMLQRIYKAVQDAKVILNSR